MVIIPYKGLKASCRNIKKILTKEKIDRQLLRQSSSTPFMRINDSYNNQKVKFDLQDGLEANIDRLMVVMSKLAAKDDGANKQFTIKIFQSKVNKRRGQTRNFYDKCSYDQRNYQNRYRSDSGGRRISFIGRIQYRQNYRDRPRYELHYRNNFRSENLNGNVRTYQDQNFRRHNNRGQCRGNNRNENYERGRS